MAFDLGRLRRGEQIAVIAAIVLFIVMFLGWYEPHDGPNLSFSAWESFSVIDIILLLTILAALGLAFLTAAQQTVALPVTAAVIATALAFLSLVLVAFRVLIDQPGFGLGAPDAAVDNTIWAWVGLIACVALFYGGYLSMRDEGTSLSDVGDQGRATFDGAAPQRSEGASAPPPPPPPAASEPPAAAPPSPPAPAEPPAGASSGGESPPFGAA
jgi:hypothetical protein